MSTPPADDVAAVQQCEKTYKNLRDELSKVIVGQDEVIEQVLVAIFARGHALLEGVPGLAKTLLVSTLARALHLSFKRIQFTPDLMPSDVTGTESFRRTYRPAPGIQVSARPALRQLDPRRRDQPHASQDAGRDARSDAGAADHRRRARSTSSRRRSSSWRRRIRWNRKERIRCPRPSSTASCFTSASIIRAPPKNGTSPAASPPGSWATFGPICHGNEILEMQQLVTRVPVSDQVLGYAHALVRASRPGTKEAPEFVNRWVSWGAGPRGVLTLVTCRQGPGDSLRPLPCDDWRRAGGPETGAAAPHRQATTPPRRPTSAASN